MFGYIFKLLLNAQLANICPTVHGNNTAVTSYSTDYEQCYYTVGPQHSDLVSHSPEVR